MIVNVELSNQVRRLEENLAKAKEDYKTAREFIQTQNESIVNLQWELHRRQQLIRRAESAMTGVWCWQNDGHDNLESITCPILIEPKDLRELLANKV